MSIKSLQVKLDCNKEVLEYLWLTHKVFNERLPGLIAILNKMRKGQCGENKKEQELYKKIADFILADDAKNAPYLLNSVSIVGWKPGSALKRNIQIKDDQENVMEISGKSWANDAAKLSAKGKLLYDKSDLLGNMPGMIQQKVCIESVSVLKNYLSLKRKWEKDHLKWLKEKREWETQKDHVLFLDLYPYFKMFQDEYGDLGPKRKRWHFYISFMKKHPEFAAWRKRNEPLHELSDELTDLIKELPKTKKQIVAADEFWKANPELDALDRLFWEYKEKYYRKSKKRKHIDGFDHMPTFTSPNYQNHPQWLSFSSPASNPSGYKNLVLPSTMKCYGYVDLILLTGADNNSNVPKWITIPFRADPRLSNFKQTKIITEVKRGKNKGEKKEKNVYVYADKKTLTKHTAQIGGAKLLFDTCRNGLPQNVYLVFSCTIDNADLSEKASEIKWVKSGKKSKLSLPNDIVISAVTVTTQDIAYGITARYKNSEVIPVRARNLWVGYNSNDSWQKGPRIDHIIDHQNELIISRKKRGKPVKNQRFNKEFQNHITNMSKDRYKKASSKIIDFALNVGEGAKKNCPVADILIMEYVKGKGPGSFYSSRKNRILSILNRSTLIEFTEQAAQLYGLRCYNVSMYGIDAVCSQCGKVGRQYAYTKKGIVFGHENTLFACPYCGYRADAQHNRVLNMHKRFLYGEKAVEEYATLNTLSEKKKKMAIEEIENRLKEIL